MSQKVDEYGSEFDWKSNDRFIKSDLNKLNIDKVDFFRSGRDSLAFIANRHKNSHKKVLFPALCCESMVTPFIRNDYKIEYYKLNENLSANVEDIVSKMQEDTVFVYMNYFGIKSLDKEFIKLLKKKFNKIIIVEDKTHDILVNEEKLEEKIIEDYIVCSLRKWLALPDGGFLYSKENLNHDTFIEQDTFFSDLRIDAMKNKSTYIKNGEIKTKEYFREKLGQANEYLDKDTKIVGISDKSLDIIKKINFKEIRDTRKHNVEFILNFLKDVKGITSLYKSSDLGNLYYPILVKNRGEIQAKLAQKNIYCPVIWSLPEGALNICSVSDYISEHMLAIPCDQRYTENDMNYICNTLKLIMEGI